MNGMRNSGYVVSLTLLATLAGHYAIHRHFERRWQAMIGADAQHLTFPAGDLYQDAPLISLKNPRAPFQRPDHQAVWPIVPVSDIQDDDGPTSIPRFANSPPTVPTPADTAAAEKAEEYQDPVKDENTALVREVIERELSSASGEEKDIWFEELKSLPAGVVADLLQVRKQLRGLPKLLGGMPDRLASTETSVFSRPQETFAEPVSQKIRFTTSDHRDAAEALESATSQLRHNLMNVATPGYKRLRVTLIDVYNASTSDPAKAYEGVLDPNDESSVLGDGCRIGPMLLDMNHGAMKNTSRPLDLAIEGNGFFVVRQGEKEYLTRCGLLTLDRDRQLCLAVIPGDGVLQPAIKVSDDVTEIQISSDGVVAARSSDLAPLKPLGRLQLAHVPSPSRLRPVGNTLLLTTEASGEAVSGEPGSGGRGIIRQGYLEQSNADVEREMAEIEELSAILKAIPQQNTPTATARSLNQTRAR